MGLLLPISLEREEMCNDREDERDRLTARVRQLEMEAASRLHRTQQSDFPFKADCQHKHKYLRRQQTRQRGSQLSKPPDGSDGGGGRRRGFCRWFNVAKGWGFITPDNGDQDVFVHHSVIHKAGFRNLGKGELVEFESRPSYKCVEATFVCGIGGVNFRGSDRRVISRKKFQNKPVVQLQQQQPQRRQCQAELQRDRFHGWSGRSTCNITNRPVVDDSAVYTVRPLVDALH
ncbi:nuclease-sensitive element-binding protein 1-like [Pomacea canaliculata]|uniref:nuclease-sensitive element-binding protein 1-like n=1 Tax=Pomacea canaliculata TaxID=400727 RepID=UPI000D73A430|nr:nuclease-sensitive element-binding protein 1-like [Pomacea canaliculata]